MRDFVRKDQEYKQKLSTLRLALEEGEQSGVSTLSMSDILIKAKNSNPDFHQSRPKRA